MARQLAPDTLVPVLAADVEPKLVNHEGHASDAQAGAPPIPAVDKNEPVVTRRELWSYYLYYNGDNGVGPNGYSMTLFQSLATSAGYDPALGVGSSCTDASSQCVLPWGKGTKSISSIVLVANGLTFAVMTLIFTTIGSAADYGTFGRWLFLVLTVICWGAQFASMSLTSPDRWRAAMALYMIGFITYGATLVFYAALFPRLARNTSHARKLRDMLESGEITAEEYEKEESLEKNRISNISTTHSNIGYIVTLCLNLSLLLPLANNAKVDNYVIVLTTAYWVVLGIWWFIYQQPRPGPPLPKGESYLTIGWKQIWEAVKQYKKLPNTFIYLVAFFLLADGFNTTGTLVNICQNDKFSFSFLQTTYLGLAQAITSTMSTLGFWYIQKYWKIRTKPMFVVTNVVTVLIPLWGMIGIWTQKFGFHNVWEFWAYNVVFGLFQAPYFAFSQTMMAELSPPGFDNMYFGLFGLSNRASSMIGPNVIQAIIDNTGNNWMGFPFLFALCTSAALVIWFAVDVEKGRHDAVAFAAAHRAAEGTRIRGRAGSDSYEEEAEGSDVKDAQSVEDEKYEKMLRSFLYITCQTRDAVEELKPVCQFYLRGQCKFGNACKNEHPAQRPGGFGNSSWTGGGQTNATSGPVLVPFTQEGMAKDMTPGAEKPMWPLSSFGSAKLEPTLIANLDESPEELRWRAVQALKSGNVSEYRKYEAEKIQEADQTYAKALSEIAQVYKHAHNSAVSAQKGIPNPAGPVYNTPTNTSSAAFGKPSAFGGGSAFGSAAPATTSAFGGSTSTPASAFGSSTTASQSAFGKPAFGQSAFGQPAFGQSAFGQPSKPVSAFGQPSQTTSAFGQPSQPTSAFGNNSQTGSAFGQPAQQTQQTQQTSAFGGGSTQQQTTSAFGQTSQPQSSFIKPATAFGSSSGGGAFSAFAGGGSSAFGAGAQQTSTRTFGQSAFGGGGNNTGTAPSTSAFGDAAKNTSTSSAFGTPASASGTQPTSAFGLPAKPVSAFGQSSQAATAFGQPSKPASAFGQAAQSPSAFGQTAQPSAFGQTTQPSVFGQASQPSAFGQTSQPASAFNPAGTSSAFAAAGLPAKPKVGPPDFAAALAAIKAQPGRDKHDGLLPPDYVERIPASAKEAFAAPRFEWGKIPEWVPPIELR